MKTKSQLMAEMDGIEWYKKRSYSQTRTFYKVKCEVCKREMESGIYDRKRHFICDYCKLKIKKKEEQKKIDYSEIMGIQTRREKQFEKAIDNIKKQVADFHKYEKAIEIARTREEMYGSIPEAMVAIELLRIGYRIIPQQKVKKYKVDFAIPKEKIVIEVDGSVYHKDSYKGDREAIIQLALGLDWKIIHIPAEYIAKDIQKVEQIIKELSKALV